VAHLDAADHRCLRTPAAVVISASAVRCRASLVHQGPERRCLTVRSAIGGSGVLTNVVAHLIVIGNLHVDGRTNQT